jgi:hypothetical protein
MSPLAHFSKKRPRRQQEGENPKTFDNLLAAAGALQMAMKPESGSELLRLQRSEEMP